MAESKQEDSQETLSAEKGLASNHEVQCKRCNYRPKRKNKEEHKAKLKGVFYYTPKCDVGLKSLIRSLAAFFKTRLNNFRSECHY